MDKSSFVVRTSLEDDGRWFALADAIPVELGAATAAGGDLPSTEAARRNQVQRMWAREVASGLTEAEAVTNVVAKLLTLGLAGCKRKDGGTVPQVGFRPSDRGR